MWNFEGGEMDHPGRRSSGCGFSGVALFVAIAFVFLMFLFEWTINQLR